MKRRYKIVGIIIVILIFLFSFDVWLSYNYLTVKEFKVSSDKIISSIRIVLVSDLHDHVFGDHNSRLIEKIVEQEPDIIILDGDMINSDSVDSHVVVDLILGLVDRAPVYYSLGNHEMSYMRNGHPELLKELGEAGAVVLNQKIEDIRIKGSRIQLGGIYEYAFDTPMQDDKSNEIAISYMETYALEAEEGEYLLMCAHRPESLYCFNYADELWGLDLVLSGHLHGGQVILPFIGGLYSSMENFFPKYDYGEYEIGDCIMIITRGLSSNQKLLPRFNNPPEIVVIDLS